MSLTFRPGDGSIRGRRVAILLADGIEADSVASASAALAGAGAVVRLLAARLGAVAAADGDQTFEPDATLETMPSVLFDAVVALVRDDLPAFITAIGRHRNWDRAEDPPRV